MYLGAHFPVRPSLLGAIEKSQALGGNALQIFGYRRHEFYFDSKLTTLQRESLDAEIKHWKESLKTSSIQEIVVHSRAVAILAHQDRDRRQKSVESFGQELALAAKLGAHQYVFHLGPHDSSVSLEQGLEMAAQALNDVLEKLPASPRIVLENVPGGGRRMGSKISELGRIVRNLKSWGSRFGFCLDVAHLWTAGYSLKTVDEAKRFWEEFVSVAGQESLALIHFNNSLLDLGCHLDQHAHLAEGHVPAEVFGYMLRHWPARAGILETPPDSPLANVENLRFLERLLEQ